MIKEKELAKLLGVTRTAIMQCRLGYSKKIKDKTYKYEPILVENDYEQKVVNGKFTTFIFDTGIEKLKQKFKKQD